MKKNVLTALTTGLLVFIATGLAQATSLIITGVIDGPRPGGTPKAVELFALHDINDLSLK